MVQSKFNTTSTGKPSKALTKYLNETIKNKKASMAVRKMALYMKYGENFADYAAEILPTETPDRK